jgi:hypothetical protein
MVVEPSMLMPDSGIKVSFSNSTLSVNVAICVLAASDESDAILSTLQLVCRLNCSNSFLYLRLPLANLLPLFWEFGKVPPKSLNVFGVTPPELFALAVLLKAPWLMLML